MRRILAAAGALSLLVGAGPALAAAEPRHGACKAKDGGILVQPGKDFEEVVATPVGVGAGLAADNPQDVGTFYLDLQGQPSSKRGKLAFTLSWTNPVSDYDLVVNGVNGLSSDNPELVSVKASHCKPVRVGVDVFVGVPVDELTLSAKGS